MNKLLTKTHPHNDLTRPLPDVIAFELAFIEEDLGRAEYEREVRKVVRENLSELLRGDDDPGPIRFYDADVWKIIREEMGRN